MPLFNIVEVFDASYNVLSGNVLLSNFMISLKVLSLQNNIFSRFIPEALFWETSMNGAYSYFTRVSHLFNNSVHVNINSPLFAFSQQLILGDNDFSLAL
jgi:hypothetical protein